MAETTPAQAPSVEALRALVCRLRQGYGPGQGDFYQGADAGYDSAADALEDLLEGRAP